MIDLIASRCIKSMLNGFCNFRAKQKRIELIDTCKGYEQQILGLSGASCAGLLSSDLAELLGSITCAV